MTVRIVLTGSECTGKTTLARALGEHYGVPVAPEYLRDYFIANSGVLTLADAEPIARGQVAGEIALERAGINPLICDTNILSSVVYNHHYYGESPVWIEEQLDRRVYNHYLLCAIDVPWVSDGQRDMPEGREYMQALFRDELQRRDLPFTELSGLPETRLKQALHIIDALL